MPGCVHRDLLHHRLVADPFHGANELDLQWIGHRDWEYAATFRIPAATLLEVVELDSAAQSHCHFIGNYRHTTVCEVNYNSLCLPVLNFHYNPS